MKNRPWITLILGIPLVVAACGSQPPPEPLEVSIDMREYAFDPADLDFQVGQEVILHLTNSGALEHEIMFGQDVMMADGRPNGYRVDMFESAGVEPVISVEKADEVVNEEGEHMGGEEHMEGEEHAEGDEHAHSGFMVQVPVTHDIYTMKFTVTEDMVGEWEVGCFLLDGVHYSSGMVGSLTVKD